jgi:hypothetical protein
MYSLAFDEDVFRPERFLVDDRFDVEAFFCAMLTSSSIDVARSLFTVDSLCGHFVSWKCMFGSFSALERFALDSYIIGAQSTKATTRS